MTQYRKTAVSRADLMRLLLTEGKDALHQSAFLFGYHHQPGAEPEPLRRPEPKPWPIVTAPLEPPVLSKPGKISAPFFRITEHTRNTKPAAVPEKPDWYESAPVYERDAAPDPKTLVIPRQPVLTRWSRLWPLLKKQLGQQKASTQLDERHLVRLVAEGKTLVRLPVLSKQGWSDRLCIVLDYSQQTQVFHEDYNQLINKLGKLHGKLNLDLRLITQAHKSSFSYQKSDGTESFYWQMPPAGTPVLILSDLGLHGEADELLQDWQALGRRLCQADSKAMVLAPVAGALDNPKLKRLFNLYTWDSQISPPEQKPIDTDKAVDDLLALLSVALVIEPRLLRTIRKLLPQSQAGIDAEARFWLHADIGSCSQCAWFKTAAQQQAYRQQLSPVFLEQYGLNAAQLYQIIEDHHAYLPQSLRMMERQYFMQLFPDCVPEAHKLEFKNWQRAMVKTAHLQPHNPQLPAWAGRYVAYQPDDLSVEMQALKIIAQRGQSEIKLDKNTDWRQLEFLLPPTESEPLPCVLYQRGEKLMLAPEQQSIKGSLIARISLSPQGAVQLNFEYSNAAKDRKVWHWPLDMEFPARPKHLATLNSSLSRLSLDTGQDKLSLESMVKPDWAHAIGRDAQGLWLEFTQQGKRWRVTAPTWCSGLGYDEYGLYADLSVHGINQRCRWLPPGRFLMGSPETERDRDSDELQHKVSLNQGFWLADTACTQELWRAVMDENPAGFKEGVNNPVEQVSWNDAQEFLQKLNGLIPGLQAELPTEAQWEYACRAGTTGPFSFGDNITPKQVNYNGDYPYAGGKKGLYRKKTVPVKFLPANPWGLYEMHGNVWEWCQDWYADYTDAPVSDPAGPAFGSYRVLRGGSWRNNAQDARSAWRGWYSPVNRLGSIGFRFAPGQASGRPATVTKDIDTREVLARVPKALSVIDKDKLRSSRSKSKKNSTGKKTKKKK